jgi:hypothetical protein
MPVKYKNLGLLITMANRKRELENGLKLFKRFDIETYINEQKPLTNKSIVIYKKPK